MICHVCKCGYENMLLLIQNINISKDKYQKIFSAKKLIIIAYSFIKYYCDICPSKESFRKTYILKLKEFQKIDGLKDICSEYLCKLEEVSHRCSGKTISGDECNGVKKTY